MNFGERLEIALKTMGWGFKDLESRTGVADSTINAIVRRGSNRSDYKDAIIEGFPPDRISYEWLRSETGPMVPTWAAEHEFASLESELSSIQSDDDGDKLGRMHEARSRWASNKLSDQKITRSTLTPILSWEHEDDLPEGEYVFIPRLDIHLSAGNGREQVEMDFVKKQPQAFRADWIRRKKLNPSKLACMKVDGDSMESLLYDGETVVIDTSQTMIKDGKVYALWYDGGERVKRLWKLPGGGLRIKSDNQEHPTIEVSPEHTDSVRILGRVVHKSGTGGL
jgi:phage repressor protein C with HTH and peptisase S24 domain